MPESLFLHELKFLKPAGTSRGVLYTKPSWIYKLSLSNGKFAQTEFPVIPGLSPEYVDHIQYEQDLNRFLNLAKVQLEAWSKIDFLQDEQYHLFISNWQAYPSFVFGLELLLFAIQANGSSVLFNTPFTIFLELSSPYTFAISTDSLIDTFTGISSCKNSISLAPIKIGRTYERSIFSTSNFGAYFLIISIKNNSFSSIILYISCRY